MRINNCLICSGKNLIEYIDLKVHPLADTFVKSKKIKIPEEKLICNICRDCNHMQLKYKINAKKRYNHVDYSYTSSNSEVSRKYLKNYYYFIKNFKSEISSIAEIGANDGFLISQFSKKIKKICFEPSNHMNKILNKKKITNIKNFFEKITKKNLKKFKDFFNVIIANNVLNHSDNPMKFFKNIKHLLTKDGIAFVEVPYSPWMVKEKKFDLIYHEHINYFSINSLMLLCKKNSLYIKKIVFPTYHGKMLRAIISKRKSNYKVEEKCLEYEKNLIQYKIEFNKYLRRLKKNFLKKIYNIKINPENIIVGIGASTKANTFLNFLELTNKHINFMTDGSKFKIGKMTPKSFIKIKDDKSLKLIKNKKIYVFFPTWNISNFLKKKVLLLNKKIKILNV